MPYHTVTSAAGDGTGEASFAPLALISNSFSTLSMANFLWLLLAAVFRWNPVAFEVQRVLPAFSPKIRFLEK